ncbi:sugar phosphate nucleotidyltransferase [Natrialbaceae archaeon A-chndr2]
MHTSSAIVLAAGEGRRLRPLTKYRPKPMLPAANKPILAHVFDALIEAGIRDITVVVGYRQNRVQSHFGPRYRNVPITYVTQSKQLGSGHALLAAESTFDEPKLVVYGDQLVDSKIISDVLEGHDPETTLATLGLIPTTDVTEYGGVICRDGTVTEIVENPVDDRDYYLNAGVYVFSPAIFEAIRAVDPRAGEHSLIDALSSVIEGDDTVGGVISDGVWVDATYPWDLLAIADDLLEADAENGTIAETAQIHETATVVEPVAIADDCVVGPGAVVGPNVCLGENVTVGANGTITRSVIDADTRLGDGVTLRECVSGRGVNVGPGSTVVGGPGDVTVDDSVHRDVAFGALLADQTRDEGGVTYCPGTIVGADAHVQAGSTVRGTVDNDVEVRG